MCPAQPAKLRCFSSPGSRIPASPAVPQLTHCSQDEASASPFRRSIGARNRTFSAGPKESNVQAQACHSAAIAENQHRNTCITAFEGSRKTIHAEGGAAGACRCLEAVTCACNRKEAFFPREYQNPQSRLPSTEHEGLEKGHQTEQNTNENTVAPMLGNDSFSQPSSAFLGGPTQEDACPTECAKSATLSTDTFSREKDSISRSTLAKMEDQQECKNVHEIQVHYDDLLRPIHRANVCTAATSVPVEEFQQQPVDSEVGSFPVCTSSSGCPLPSLASSELLYLLQQSIRSAKSAAVAMANYSSCLSNMLETEAQTITGDSTTDLLVPGHHERGNASEIDSSCLVTPANSRLPPPSGFPVLTTRSQRTCHSPHNCIHTVVPGVVTVAVSSPQIRRCFHSERESTSPLQPYSLHAYAASKTTCNNQSLADLAGMEDLKLACPSSPPSTVIPCPVTQRRTARSAVSIPVVKSNEDTTVTMKNERPHRDETREDASHHLGVSSTSNVEERCKAKTEFPQDSKAASCAEKLPELRIFTVIQDTKDLQRREVEESILHTHKVASKYQSQPLPGSVVATPSATLLSSPHENSDNKLTACTSAGRSLTSRFLAHIRQGIRLTRRRHRSTSTTRIHGARPLREASTNPGGAGCGGEKGLHTFRESCVRLQAQSAGTKEDSAAHDAPAEFRPFTYDSRETAGVHLAVPTMKMVSQLAANAEEAGHTTNGSELCPAGLKRHSSQRAASQDHAPRDSVKEALLLDAPVFSVSASHSCLPPTDAWSNSYSRDPTPLSGYLMANSRGSFPSTQLATYPKAVRSCFSQQQEVPNNVHSGAATISSTLEDSNNWRETANTLNKDYCQFSVHDAKGCLDTPRTITASLDVIANRRIAKGGSCIHQSGRLLEKAELQKWQDLLELNNIIQRGAR
ncbi:hypothetical protein, conserved [Eimeria maxima]|uniref:Proteophosphoglycan 5, related n=1 Tax=Eimeria maxima TaxID=5804 RepID=U6MFT3_EIMMA|nr:hypothetical protein, conserved [Eimeria maxima]CDJ61918.1 hypothetical protein, conserved [Eimeria maxima]